MPSSVVMFPGQGAQFAGMGDGLWERFPETVSVANQILGYDVERLCRENPDNVLSQTDFTQPAMYVVNYLHYRAFTETADEFPGYFLGHSLGEFNALQAAGVFDFETGLRVVQKRGALMATVTQTGMAAVIGANTAETERILKESCPELDIANINAPTQTVVAGPIAALEKAADCIDEEGYAFVPLKVSAAFHSRYMRPQKDAFRHFLASFQFRACETPVISNYSATPYPEEPSSILDVMVQQMDHPVRWMPSILYLRSRGDFRFVEVGPGDILKTLVRKINASD